MIRRSIHFSSKNQPIGRHVSTFTIFEVKSYALSQRRWKRTVDVSEGPKPVPSWGGWNTVAVASWIHINHQIYSNITCFMMFVHQHVSYVVLNMQYKVFLDQFWSRWCFLCPGLLKGKSRLDDHGCRFSSGHSHLDHLFLRTATTWGMQVIEKTWKHVPNKCDIAGFLNQKVKNVKTLWFVATDLSFLPHQFYPTSLIRPHVIQEVSRPIPEIMRERKASQFPLFEAILWQHSLSQLKSRCINIFDPVVYQYTQIHQENPGRLFHHFTLLYVNS